MKYLYKCETCGKTFEDSNEAYHCERSHRTAEVVSTYELDKATRDLCYDGEFFIQHYAPGENIPDRVWMKLPKVDEDGTYIRDENDVIQYEAVCYTIDRKSINSTVACTLSRSINLGQLEALERHNAYEAERAAKHDQEG